MLTVKSTAAITYQQLLMFDTMSHQVVTRTPVKCVTAVTLQRYGRHLVIEALVIRRLAGHNRALCYGAVSTALSLDCDTPAGVSSVILFLLLL